MSRSRISTFPPAAFALLAASLVTGCQKESGGSVATAAAAEAPTVAEMTVTATDFHYDATDTVYAGPTTVRLVNHGTELHHMTIASIPPGRTVQELLTVVESDAPFPAGFRLVGGPNPAAPGTDVSATLDFAPGHYVMFCVIPSPDGKMHVAKGMEREFTVIPGAGPVAAMPAADEQMTLMDYGFQIAPDLTAGTHTIRVENHASQPHEAVILKLEPGKTADDALAWVGTMTGPPPFAPVGGVSAMDPGAVVELHLTFTPGDYGLFCFVPDATDGKPHFMHGMVRTIHVSEPSAHAG
ncbi:MAG: hypothetical protein IH616_21785 [Gemmatimonadales bacterium]|nr:hypothetical protein [Gemmatimonadales bacterium]